MATRMRKAQPAAPFVAADELPNGPTVSFYGVPSAMLARASFDGFFKDLCRRLPGYLPGPTSERRASVRQLGDARVPRPRHSRTAAGPFDDLADPAAAGAVARDGPHERGRGGGGLHAAGGERGADRGRAPGVAVRRPGIRQASGSRGGQIAERRTATRRNSSASGPGHGARARSVQNSPTRSMPRHAGCQETMSNNAMFAFATDTASRERNI